MARHRPAVIIALDALIAALEARPAKLRRARTLIVEALTESAPAVTAPKAGRAAIADGSVADRILAVIRQGPASKAAIVAASGARPIDAMLTLKELVADGHVKASGATTKRRWSMAKGGAK